MVAAFLALALIGGVVTLLVRGATTDSVAAPTTSAVTDAAPTEPAEQPSADSAPVSDAEVRCWDGSTAAEPAECPIPGDEDARYEYLRYAFPSLDEYGTCVPLISSERNGYVGMTVMWDCELGSSLIRYRYWENTKDADKHYGAKFKRDTRAVYDVQLYSSHRVLAGWAKEKKSLQVNKRAGTARHALTIWLPELHLSLSAEGASRVQMWDALNLARIREPAQLLGYRTDSESDPVGFVLYKR